MGSAKLTAAWGFFIPLHCYDGFMDCIVGDISHDCCHCDSEEGSRVEKLVDKHICMHIKFYSQDKANLTDNVTST